MFGEFVPITPTWECDVCKKASELDVVYELCIRQPRNPNSDRTTIFQGRLCDSCKRGLTSIVSTVTVSYVGSKGSANG